MAADCCSLPESFGNRLDRGDVLDTKNVVFAAFHTFTSQPQVAYFHELKTIRSNAHGELGAVSAGTKILTPVAEAGGRLESWCENHFGLAVAVV